MTPEQLREALAWDSDYVTAIREARENLSLEPLEVLVDAARSYLRILEEGREVWWCEPHYRTGDEDTCQMMIPLDNTCRMVRMRLTPMEDDR